MILSETHEAKIEDDRIGHDLLDGHTKSAHETAEAVYFHVEKEKLVKSERERHQIVERRGHRHYYGYDKIELYTFVDAPQGLEHFCVQQDDEPVENELE